MSEPWSEDDGILREWAPLSGLLREIPLTVRKGLFLENVSLTCVDAVSEYIAVGTNIGVVYWYHRESHNIQRLRPEKSGFNITCVKIASSVDFMVAAGDRGGTVTVFRIPKPTPDWLPSPYKQNSNMHVERYTVGGLHSASVTALEWSMNGQKLFSGDLLGLVVYTEIDFYMNLSKACEVLNEKYCIVQLSFNHHCQTLLVATEYRCILAHKKDSWRVIQVGQKERRSLCHVGATFFLQPSSPLEPLVYSGRAGLRFWQADKEGTVHKTIIFKDAVRKSHPSIRLLRPRPLSTPMCDGDLGPLLVWRGNLLVTHDSSSLLILDPEKTSVVGSLSGLTNLHSITVSQNEIFIIEGARNIMRLSYTPDTYKGYGSNKDSPLAFLELKVAPVADTLLDLTVKLKDTASKFVNTQPSNAINGMLGDQEIVSTAAEATELDLPPVLPLESTAIEELTVQLDPRIQIFDQIGKQSFDDIIFSSDRKVTKKYKKRSKSKNATSVLPTSESNSDSVSTTSVRDTSPPTSDCESTRPASRNNNHIPQIKLGLDLVSCTEFAIGGIPPDILPDLRSPDTILKDLRDKELLVAKALNLEEVLLNFDEVTPLDKDPTDTPVSTVKNDPTENNDKINTSLKVEFEDSLHNNILQPEEGAMKYKEVEVSYGPPSGSSNSQPSLEVSVHPLAQDYNPQKDILEQTDGWRKVLCPETVLTLSVANDYICISGPSMSVYYSVLDKDSIYWQKLPYKANQLNLSPSAEVVWKLDFGVANALIDKTTGPYGTGWEVAARGVENVSLGESMAWYISAGRIHLQKELSRVKPFRESISIPCPVQVMKICCMQTTVLALTVEYSIMIRCGITKDCVEGTHWRLLNLPSIIHVGDIVLGPKQTAWIIDKTNKLYFSDNYTNDISDWWQVCINNYVFENAPLCQIAASPLSVWVSNKVSQFVFMNSSAIKGDRWIPVLIKGPSSSIKWRQMTAEGVFEEKGSLWFLSTTAELYHTLPNTDVLKPIVLPCHGEDVVTLSAAPHALWILTQLGHIYIRQGLGETCPDGTKWRQLNLEQISTEVTFRHISCGCDVVWACDIKGDVYMVVGSPYEIATDIFSPAWVAVEGRPQPGTLFTKVFVSSETHMVWALDNKNNIYVREGIFPDFQLGTGWVLVNGIQATSLSVRDETVYKLVDSVVKFDNTRIPQFIGASRNAGSSPFPQDWCSCHVVAEFKPSRTMQRGSAVWALSPDGSVFRRHGISQNNYIGNYWIQISGSVSVLSASVSDGLWGISDSSGTLLVYSNKTIYLSQEPTEPIGIDKDDDWEVI